ncbi:hypothetical protein D3C80_922550 [compost metagenome]
MSRFDTHHVEDIANQLQQPLGAVGRDLQGEAIELALIGLFQGDFQHADDRIHGGTDFVAHGRQKGGLGPAGRIGLVLGLAQCFEQVLAFVQLVFQGLLGGSPLFDQGAQIHVPDHKTKHQHHGGGADLQDQRAVIAPQAVADHRVGSPTIGQLRHFIGGDAQQRLVEDRRQFRRTHCRRKRRGRRHVAHGRYDPQAVLEQAADEVAGTDLGVKCCVGLAPYHHFHDLEGILGFDQGDIAMVLGHVRDHRCAADYGQAFVLQLLDALRAARVGAADQHIGIGQVRAREVQVLLARLAAPKGADHVRLAVAYLVDHGLDRTRGANVEFQAGTQADLVQHIGSDAAKALVIVEEGQGGVAVIDDHPDLRVAVEPALFPGSELQWRAAGQHAGATPAPTAQDAQALTVANAAQGGIDDAQQ